MALFLVSSAFSLYARPSCVICGVNDTDSLTTLQAHKCLALHFGSAEKTGDATLEMAGFRLGLSHMSLQSNDIFRAFVNEQSHFTGLSLLLIADHDIGTTRGVAITGFFSGIETVRGWQCTGLFSAANTLSGAQTSLALSRVNGTAKGVQLGLVTYAKELKGVQFGLLNINASGWIFPLINIGW